MNTLVFWIILIIGGLVVLNMIPGVKELVKPILSMVFKFIEFLFQNAFWFVIGIFKTLWSDHLEIFKNLTHTAEEIDPTLVYRKERVK